MSSKSWFALRYFFLHILPCWNGWHWFQLIISGYDNVLAVLFLEPPWKFLISSELLADTFATLPSLHTIMPLLIVDVGFGALGGGAYRCFPVPIFHSPFVHQSRFPSTDVPRPYIPQFLYYPVAFLPPLGTPYVYQSLCFPVPLLPSPYVLQPLYSPVSIFPINGFPSLCSPKIFSSLHVHQYPCSPVHIDVPQCLFP